jgi:hypothetical protein
MMSFLEIYLGEGSLDFQTTVLLEFRPGPDNIRADIP